MVRKTKIHLVCKLGTHITIGDCRKKANPLRNKVLRTKKNLKIQFEIKIKILFKERMASYFFKKTSPWYFIILGKFFINLKINPFYRINKRSRMK